MSNKDREQFLEWFAEGFEYVVMPHITEMKQTLREHSETLEDHGNRLESIERKLDATIKRVDTHSRKLRM